MDAGKLLTYAAVGVGGYFLYETFFATPAAVAASAPAAPAAPAAGSTPVITNAPSPTVPAGSGPAQPPAPAYSGPSLASAWSQAQVAAASDPAYISQSGMMNGSQWNWYLKEFLPTPPTGYTGEWLPEVPNTSNPVTAATYWGIMQPILAQAGLSGFLSGLGYWGMGDAASDAATAGDIAAFNASGAAALLNPLGVGPEGGVGISIPSNAPGGQANLTSFTVDTASPQLLSSWISQNSGLLLAAGLAIGALVILPSMSSAGRRR